MNLWYVTWSIYWHVSNPCRLLHPYCIHILRWSLKCSVKRTQTGSTISTNKSAWSANVWGLSLVCEADPYIGCPYPCPWFLGGHGCNIIGSVTIFEYMNAKWIAWVGMGENGSLLMDVVWVWVQIQRKCWALVWSGPWNARSRAFSLVVCEVTLRSLKEYIIYTKCITAMICGIFRVLSKL